MKHVLVTQSDSPDHGIGFIVPDGRPEGGTLGYYTGFKSTGPWFKCDDCQRWVSIYGYDAGAWHIDGQPVAAEQPDSGAWDINGRGVCSVSIPRSENFDGFKSCKDKHMPRAPGDGIRTITVQVPAEYMSTSFEWLIANGMLCKQKPVTRGVIKRLAQWPLQQAFFLLCGGSGIGKTSCAWAIAREQAQHGREVMVVDCVQLRARWNTPFGDARERVITQAARARYVILDEFGTPQGSDAWSAAMHRLLDERIKANNPTIIFSRVKPQQIAYGEDVASRLKRFEWIGLDGIDRRAAKTIGTALEKAVTQEATP